MEAIKAWVLEVSAVVFIVAVASVITPKNAAGRVGTMIGSILLTIVLVSPVFEFSGNSLKKTAIMYEEMISDTVFRVTDDMEKLQENVIEDKIEAYILEKAKEQGIDCEIEIKFDDGKPSCAEVFARSESDALEIKGIIEREIGIGVK